MDLEGCDHSCMQVVSLQQHTTRSAMQPWCNNCDHSCREAMSLQERDRAVRQFYHQGGASRLLVQHNTSMDMVQLWSSTRDTRGTCRHASLNASQCH